MKTIDRTLLQEVTRQARASERLRKNYNFHPQASDPLQRMLNAMEPGTYVQPHKHQDPDKREVFLVLTGKVAVVSFDDKGDIIDKVILEAGGDNFGVEIPARLYHTILSLAEGSVVYEVKDGPYQVSDDKNFAPWAPAENEEGAKKYLEYLTGQLNGL